jgi:hypothetical protein
MTPRQRKRAVADYYRAADEVLRGEGVDDFVQVVTPLAQTTEKLPALATGNNRLVSLTRLGRGKGRC